MCNKQFCLHWQQKTEILLFLWSGRTVLTQDFLDPVLGDPNGPFMPPEGLPDIWKFDGFNGMFLPPHRPLSLIKRANGIPSVHENSEVLENPEVPQDPEVLENPEVPEDPEVLENPEVLEGPEVPENPENSGNPENPDEQRRYRNLYGYEDFNTTAADPELITGLVKTINLTDQFRREAQPDITPVNKSLYDFIVIGAGTAGSAIASRLSEWGVQRVLLIEAGDEEVYYMDIPLLSAMQQHNPKLNWNYTIERSNKYCLGVIGERCRVPRGRVMGGSSVLNYMLATRGHPDDYDEWARAGNDGWDYQNVLKYFKKLENMQIPKLAEDTMYHGTKGPVTINYAPFHTPATAAFIRAAKEMGYQERDYNSDEMIGVSYTQSSIFKGSRMSANRAYLHNKHRRNLHVTKRSRATKILITHRDRRAHAVEFIKHGKLYRIFVRKEVILSAGAFESPRLLMLSGIGPAKHLRSLRIPVIQNSPVGDNFQDHIGFTSASFFINQPITITMKELLRPGTPYFKDYLLNQTGPFSSTGGIEGILYTDVFNQEKRTGRPNVEHIFYPLSLGSNALIAPDLGYKPEVEAAYDAVNDRDTYSIVTLALRPKSRGTIRLNSANIYDQLKIVPNYFSDPEDMRVLIAAIRQSISIGYTNEMQRFNSTLFNLELPACREFQMNSDEYFQCIVRQLPISMYHVCGTCKMGPKNDPTAVVNPQLQVIGIRRLRVADASIIPTIPSGHLNIPTYMIAEKLSDMVKQYWSYPRRYL